MFFFLNRLVKLGVLGLWLAGGYWIWTQRERGLPIWDYYQVWDAAGRKEPAELPTFEGDSDTRGDRYGCVCPRCTGQDLEFRIDWGSADISKPAIEGVY